MQYTVQHRCILKGWAAACGDGTRWQAMVRRVNKVSFFIGDDNRGRHARPHHTRNHRAESALGIKPLQPLSRRTHSSSGYGVLFFFYFFFSQCEPGWLSVSLRETPARGSRRHSILILPRTHNTRVATHLRSSISRTFPGFPDHF